MYNLDKIYQLLQGMIDFPAGRIEQFDSIDSTNRHLLEKQHAHQTVCLAEHQSAGRGRRGRAWADSPGGSILFSFAWQLSRAQPQGLSLMVGVVLVEALAKQGITEARLKWPNDVLHNNKKLAGILVEVRAGKCVVGIGINVKIAAEKNSGIGQPWTDLNSLGININREQLVADLITGLNAAFKQFEHNGFGGFAETWQRYHAWQDCEVEVIGENNSLRGVATGIDIDGALLLRCDDSVQRVVYGDVSLRQSHSG